MPLVKTCDSRSSAQRVVMNVMQIEASGRSLRFKAAEVIG